METNRADIPLKRIERTDLLGLAKFAEFELEESQIDYFLDELNRQRRALLKLLEARELMEKEGWDQIMSHGIPYSASNRPPLREDIIEPFANGSHILEHAPLTDLVDDTGKGSYFLVPPPP